MSTTHPSTIGRFKVERVLGTGGMGAVYKAFDPTLQRVVAVKTVRPDVHDPDLLDRLLREAQACGRLRHPNVVTIFEAGEIDGTVYVAMEYLAGDNLHKVLEKGGLAFEETLHLLVQVLDALDSVHREGVIHRDIKPANIHRQPDGFIKLVDFGLARIQQTEQLTMAGVVMATPAYASPEQLKAEPIDHRTDIYSTGVVAFEMITGHRPFVGDISSLFYKVVHEDVPAMDVVWSREFPPIEAIIRKAMSKSPDDRYQSAAEMRDELRAFLAEAQPAIAAVQNQGAAVTSATTQKATERIRPVPLSAAASAGAPGPRATTVKVPRGRSASPLWIAAAAAMATLLLLGGYFGLRRGATPPAPTSPTSGMVAPPTSAAPAPPPAPVSTTPPATTPAPVESAPGVGAPAVTNAEAPAVPPAAPASDRATPAPPTTSAAAPPPAADPAAKPGEFEISIDTANTVTAGASTPPPAVARRGSGPGAARGGARGRSPVAQTPRQRANQDVRCARLVERVTLGDVLNQADRTFLLRNCGGTGRANGNR